MSDYIPRDNVEQILKRLPVKSLLRFRCVCKQWKEVIEHPIFVQDHLAVQKPLFITASLQHGLVVVDPHHIPSTHTIRSHLEGFRLTTIGTNHGIVCHYDFDYEVWLWNPSIRKYLSLPSYSSKLESFQDYRLDCAAFWIDPSNKEFKVIIMVFDHENDEVMLPADVNGVLYSSIQDDWSVIPHSSLRSEWWMPTEMRAPAPVMIASVAHWVGTDEFDKRIMSFDFRDESFDFLDMPNLNYFGCPEIESELCKWQGALSLMCCYPDFPYRCDLYRRKEGSWAKMFSFNFLPPACDMLWVRLLGEWNNKFWVLGQYRWENDEGVNKHDLLLYDSKVGSIHLMHDFKCWYCDYEFVPSLLFP